MTWYRTGTVNVTNASKTVTGSGTNWTGLGSYSLVGSGFRGPDGLVYEIEAVNGATSLTLVEPYFSASATNKSYALMPTLGLAADLAVAVSALTQRTAGTVDAATPLGKTLLAAPTAAEARAAIDVEQTISEMVGGEWSTGGVAVTASIGALANASASITYRRVGRTVFFTATINLISNGSAAGSLRLALPLTAARTFCFTGRENTSTGAQLLGLVSAGQNLMLLWRYDNSYPGGDNRTLVISGVYETSAP